jgi:hypothetical protein
MEDQLGDIIYILLTILFVAIGAIRQAFKSPKSKPAPYDPEREFREYDDFGEERQSPWDLDEEKTETGKGEYSWRDSYEDLKETKIHTQKEVAKDEIQPGQKNIGKELTVQDDVGITGKKRKTKFNLRKAVIYSTILNRPDF